MKSYIQTVIGHFAGYYEMLLYGVICHGYHVLSKRFRLHLHYVYSTEHSNFVRWCVNVHL